MTHTPTPEQSAIIEAVSHSTNSIMVTAYAGCAKTSTIEMAAPTIPLPGLFLAFNKRIAEEGKKRLPSNFDARTMNGLGHGAWLRAIPNGRSVKLDEKKLGKLITQIARERKVQLASDQWDDCRKLVTKVIQAGLLPRKYEALGYKGLVPDTDSQWADIASDEFISDELVIDLARDVLDAHVDMARQGIISFDDQIYCPTLMGGKFPHYPFVFVDEAQDLSPLNHVMLGLTAADRIAAVGDPKQAIYAFRGADGRSMTNLRKLKSEWTDRPLATTFRCPRAIVARQLDHAPGFVAHSSAPEGLFTTLRAPETDLAGEWRWTWLDIEAMRQRGEDIAILCRNNAPLISLAFKLLRQGTGVHMLGRDLGKGLIALSRKLAKDDSTPTNLVRSAIEEWYITESTKLIANGKEEKVDAISDRSESLLAILDQGARDAGELRALIEKLFNRENGVVTLSTIHKAKGLEWGVVVHLDPWRIPSKQARTAAARGDTIPLEQENNLRYVAETRTKRLLITANAKDFA